MREFTPKEIAVNTLIRLLAPALTDHQGMMARQREEDFRQAMEVLVGPTGPQAPLVSDE